MLFRSRRSPQTALSHKSPCAALSCAERRQSSVADSLTRCDGAAAEQLVVWGRRRVPSLFDNLHRTGNFIGAIYRARLGILHHDAEANINTIKTWCQNILAEGKSTFKKTTKSKDQTDTLLYGGEGCCRVVKFEWTDVATTPINDTN